MEKAEISKGCSLMGVDHAKDEVEEMISTLPKERNWNGIPLCLYQGFWCTPLTIRGIVSFRTHFQAQDNDVILATAPKSGTTWTSALIFTIANRTRFTLKESPLLTANPHELVPSFEFNLYSKTPSLSLEDYPHDPRIFYTHTPYAMLPPSIKISNCKIVYVCRNPLDMFISQWHFSSNLRPHENVEQFPMEEAFEMFFQGVHSFGPFWNHILGYWKASLERPEKFLILKYEDLKEDNILCIKRLAEFLGFPFSAEEEKLGVIEEISRLCSFDNLKELEVNKNGKHHSGMFSFNAYFRKGEVGDWGNYLPSSMGERMEKLIQEKFQGSGVTFSLPPSTQKD